MSKELFSMSSRPPAAVSPRPDDGVGPIATPQRPRCIGGTGSVAPVPQASPTVMQTCDLRRHLHKRRGNAAENALARLCTEELNEQHATVVDRDKFCWRVGRRLLRRLGI
jgi:hypothetical protein